MPKEWDDRDDERWWREMRAAAVSYLQGQPGTFGSLGEAPAWYVAPCVSIWAVQALDDPEAVGWWVICGDLPSDWLPGDGILDPRHAAAAFAARWRELAARMADGREHPSIKVGNPKYRSELAPLLAARARLLAEFAEDASLWDA